MSTTTLVSVEAYLGTVYEPECEYVDGRLVERNVGEVDHSDVQSSILHYIRSHYKNLWAGVAVRVQAHKTRLRVPDVAIITGGKPKSPIVTTPPSSRSKYCPG